MTRTTTDAVAPPGAGASPSVEELQGGTTADGASTAARERPSALVRAPFRAVRGTRARLLLTCITLLALSLLASLLLIRVVLVDQVSTRVEAELAQEIRELERLVGGTDPETGQPFGSDVGAIFQTFFARNVPSDDEGQYAFVDGVPVLTNLTPPAELTTDRAFVREMRGLTEPRRGTLQTTAGPAEYLAVPLRSPDATGQQVTRGVFVDAHFPAEALERVDATVTRIGIGLLTVLALGSAAAWGAAGRVLAPLRHAVETARSIQDTNLTSRIPVSGSDDIADLSRTFNAMLDRLERAAELQRGFVSDAGHELRTPLTIVRGHLELMTDDPEDRRQTVQLVTEELDRMSRLVDDLLLLAKSERPDFLQRRPVHLSDLVPTVFTKASALAPRDWHLEGVADACVDGDPQRLTQALTQLAQNATQHTVEGQSVALGSSARDGAVRIWVRDEGEGIEPADQERIFERFARAAAGRRRSEGSGLGLAIVQAIAEAHDGRVELESRPGEGATFTLVLPTTADPQDCP